MANDVQNDGYKGQQTETTDADHFNELAFLVNQIIGGKWTLTVGQVKTVRGGALSPPCLVGVQPMVNQVNGQGEATPHGIINNVPVFCLQGGGSGFVADPVVGDIGILAIASRDISAVKANKAPSNPGSGRSFDPADAMYIGGLLNAAPTQYVQITADGINIVFPGGVSIALSENGITLTVGAHSIVLSSTGITLDGLAWDTHTHAVTTAPGETGPPVL